MHEQNTNKESPLRIFNAESKLSIAENAALIAIASLVLISIFFASKSYVLASCKQEGGSIYNVDSGSLCAVEYTDGGTECNSSLECQGNCYVHAEGQKPMCELDSYVGKCRGDLDSQPNCE